MSAPPGWYPDPGGQPGRYRYWDGQTWSAATTAQPTTPPPTAGLGQRPPAAPGSTLLMPGGASVPLPPRRPSRWPWVAGIALALAILVVVVVLVVRGLGGGNPIVDGGPSSTPSSDVCPDAVESSASPTAQPGDRVRSGQLSFPMLGDPFSPVFWDQRVPFGRDVQEQQATVEADANGTPTWVASVLVARLLAGDGFFGPEQGAKTVATCVVQKFYGDAVVTRQDTRSEAITVDGHQAWTIEGHLSFHIPDIKTTGETMIIVVVDTGDEAGLFFASVPDTSPEFMVPARQAEAALRVG